MSHSDCVPLGHGDGAHGLSRLDVGQPRRGIAVHAHQEAGAAGLPGEVAHPTRRGGQLAQDSTAGHLVAHQPRAERDDGLGAVLPERDGRGARVRLGARGDLHLRGRRRGEAERDLTRRQPPGRHAPLGHRDYGEAAVGRTGDRQHAVRERDPAARRAADVRTGRDRRAARGGNAARTRARRHQRQHEVQLEGAAGALDHDVHAHLVAGRRRSGGNQRAVPFDERDGAAVAAGGIDPHVPRRARKGDGPPLVVGEPEPDQALAVRGCFHVHVASQGDDTAVVRGLVLHDEARAGARLGVVLDLAAAARG